MKFIDIVSSTFSLFSAIAVGYFARKKKFINENSTIELSRFVIRILFPIYLFRSAVTYMTRDYIFSAPVYPVLNIGIGLIMLFFSSWFCKKVKIIPEREPIFKTAVLVGNTGFMGLMFATLFFGPEEVMAAILYDFGGSLFLFLILLPALLDRQKNQNPLHVLKEPNIIAVISGIILGIAEVKIPEFLVPSFNLISQITLPLALILCGTQLASIYISTNSKYFQVFYLVFLKMIVIPFLMTLIVWFMPFKSSVKQLLVLMAAMPSGISLVNFANTYDQDSDFAAVSIFATTLFSIIWIPALLLLLQNIF